ncbi:MAG: N-acetylglutaminylglutamine synthetase [Oligoflexus sp.]
MQTLPELQFRQGSLNNKSQSAEQNVVLECGWGRVVFAHTFSRQEDVANILLEEQPGQRDLAFYVQDPHVILSHAPQSLFLDPSHAYRLDFRDYTERKRPFRNIRIRKVEDISDISQINSIYKQHKMMPFSKNFTWQKRTSEVLEVLLAEDELTGQVVGSIMGIDHVGAFKDPEGGSSLWAVAVSKFCNLGGAGEALIRSLIEKYQRRGRTYIDLSVMHYNDKAIRLYEKLGFKRIPVYCIKHKNRINHPLFTEPNDKQKALNPYAQIIVDEACRRGVVFEIIDASRGFFKLKFAGRSIHCMESLTDLTSSIAFQRCDDKELTTKLVAAQGVPVPKQILDPDQDAAHAFLKDYERVVVKPVNGEQGKHVYVGITDEGSLIKALEAIRDQGETPILQEFVDGMDLRVIVIGGRFVAAAVRKPPMIVGDGQNTAENLIRILDRRRSAATDGESRVHIDGETERCIRDQGFALTDVLPEGVSIQVRKTANLHTGGSIEDVTDLIHPTVKELSELCARTLDIPVVGLDFMISDLESDQVYFIEANERPGLANHEPQPVVERFMDLLFPESVII